MVLPPETAVAMERRGLVFVCACLLMLLVGNAQAGIFHRHPRQWEALYGDMSAPCLLVVLMKLGVGRVGSLVQVPGFPSNESASPHSNWLLPWELKLGLPSTLLKYRLISTHTPEHTHRSCKGSSSSTRVGWNYLIKRLWPVLCPVRPNLLCENEMTNPARPLC